jgi:hypothetical protein
MTTTDDAEQAKIDEALTAFRTARDTALREVVDGIARLTLPLARLVAADRIRRELIGDHYRFNAISNPPHELWSGEYVVKLFLAALPDRLTPEDFFEDIAIVAEQRVATALGRELTIHTCSPESEALVEALLSERNKGKKRK